MIDDNNCYQPTIYQIMSLAVKFGVIKVWQGLEILIVQFGNITFVQIP